MNKYETAKKSTITKQYQSPLTCSNYDIADYLVTSCLTTDCKYCCNYIAKKVEKFTNVKSIKVHKNKFAVTRNKSCKFEEQIFKYADLLCDFSFISSVFFFVENTTITVFIVLDKISVEKTSQIAYAVLDYELNVNTCCFGHVYFENNEISDEEVSQAIIVFSKKNKGSYNNE